MAWDYSHGTPPRWTGPMPMTVPTLAEQTAHGPIVQLVDGYALTTDGHIVHFGADSDHQRDNVPTTGGFVQVSRNGWALTADGHVHGFGRQAPFVSAAGGYVQVTDGYALTADGHIVRMPAQTQVAPSEIVTGPDLPVSVGGGYVHIAAARSLGISAGYALTADGHVVSFDSDYQVDNGDGTTTGTSVDLPPGGGYLHLHANGCDGSDYSILALDAGGKVEPLDPVPYSETDDNNTRYATTPWRTGAGAGVLTQMVGGWNGGYGLAPDGHVVAVPGTAPQNADLPPSQVVQLAGGCDHGYGLDPSGHVWAFGDATGGHRKYLPLFPVWFMEHPLIEDASNAVSLHVASATEPTTLPYEIDWGDGTTLTPVPVGTTSATAFTHTYADDKDHTVVLRVPGQATGIDTTVAHKDAASAAAVVQYTFTYDTTTKQFNYSPVQVYDAATSTWHNAELNIYDSATGTWVK